MYDYNVKMFYAMHPELLVDLLETRTLSQSVTHMNLLEGKAISPNADAPWVALQRNN